MSEGRFRESSGRLGGQLGGMSGRSPTLFATKVPEMLLRPLWDPARAQPPRLKCLCALVQSHGCVGSRGPSSHFPLPRHICGRGTPLIHKSFCICVTFKHKTEVSISKELVLVTNLDADFFDCNRDVNR